MLGHTPHPRVSLPVCDPVGSSGAWPPLPLQLLSVADCGAAHGGPLSLPGLPPGALRYASGVRGGLQRRPRRGPGRRRRQLQPDASRLLRHRSAGDSPPLLFPASALPGPPLARASVALGLGSSLPSLPHLGYLRERESGDQKGGYGESRHRVSVAGTGVSWEQGLAPLPPLPPWERTSSGRR